MSLSRGDREMLTVVGLTKRLGQKEILRDVNLTLSRKSITGLVGANGAGKTTLIKCLTGIYRPEQGRVSLGGCDLYLDAQVRAKIGYVADQGGLFLNYTTEQMISFYAGIYPAFDQQRFMELNDTFGLRTNLAARALSKGQRTVLALMLNLSIRPDYLLLDEPAAGLDPLIKRELFKTLLGEVEERELGVLISSHNLDDLERFCDQIAFIGQGRLVQVGSVDEMKGSLHKLHVSFDGDVPGDLASWPGVISVEKVGKLVTVCGAGELESLKSRLMEAGAARVEPMEMTLEEMIIQRMKGEKRLC